jgi:hypothetical protein
MPPAIVRGGGDLVFSDNPEYLAATTADSLGHTHGEFIEGVLYKQTSQSTLLPGSGPLTSNGTFRLYMNHENRTTVPKRLYYVITNPSTVDSVDVSMGNFGIAHKPGDPVVAGQRALEQYLGGAVASAIPPPSLPPNQPCAGSALFTTIPHGMTCVFFVYELSQPTVTNEGTYPDVVNFIADITTTGPVQVGVVAVNGAPNNYSNFEVLPLNYEFNNTIGLTYQTDQLVNLTEKGHVHGTFPYNHVQVRIPYAVANADRYGWRLGDNTPSSPEYAVSRDAIPSLNIGNFGVQYVVSIVPSGAQSGMATQVLIEPRGARPRTDSTTGNAVAAEVTTSSIASPFAVPCNGKITDPNTGAGVGFVLGNDTFVLNLIPPAGDTMPIAVVLGPAYVKNTATATAPSGATSSSSLVLQLPDPNAGIALCAPAD